MLRRLAKILALLTVFGAGLGSYYATTVSKQEKVVLERSNILVWQAIQSPYSPRFPVQTIRANSSPDSWTVSGEIAMLQSHRELVQAQYSAVIRKACVVGFHEKCWRLDALRIGDEVLVNGHAADIDVSEAPKAADSYAEDKAESIIQRLVNSVASITTDLLDRLVSPETETGDKAITRDESTDTGKRDLSVADTGSMPVSEVSIGGESSDLEYKRPVETEANPLAEVDAQTIPGVSIVIDTADTHVSEAPKTADSDAENGTIEVSVINTENKVNRVVYLIQDRLNRLGYVKPTPLELDGQVGPRTRAAIAIYQRAHGLEINRQPSRALLRHIEGRVMAPAQVSELIPVTESKQSRGLKAPTQVAVVKAPSQGGFRVQLGTFRSSESAPILWRTLQSRHGDLLGGLEHRIRRVDAGGEGIFYFLYAGPLPTAASAHSLCGSLIERKVDCLAVKS